MKRDRIQKAEALLWAALLFIGLLVSCGRRIDHNISQGIQASPIRGTVTMAGSTSMETFANALAEGFMSRYPYVTVTAEFTGSSAGIEAVLAGSVDIGNSSRRLREEEKAAGAVEYVAAIDAVVIVVDAENTVRELTKEQLCGIYKGEIRNWSEAGGRDAAVVVIGREAGSGTREAFEALLGMEDMCSYANELNSTGAVMARVSSTPGAIGYVSLDVLDDTVSVLALDGVMPTEESIRSGSYRLSRPFVMVTRGSMAEQSEAVQELFIYLESEEGKALLRKVMHYGQTENKHPV